MLTETTFKAQARKLKELLAAHEGSVQYQDALEILAQVQGAKNWKTLAAQLKAQPGEPVPPLVVPKEVESVPQNDEQTEIPGFGFLFRVPVTVDTTKTAYIFARGATRHEAIDNARAFAFDGKARFELDEGNWRGSSDYYCPDRDGVEQLDGQDCDEESVCENGVQVGAYLVQVELVDGKHRATLSIFDPEEQEPEVLNSDCDLPLDASTDDLQVYCAETAGAFHQTRPNPRGLDLRAAEKAFHEAVCGQGLCAAADILKSAP